jgi:hypothetical protein
MTDPEMHILKTELGKIHDFMIRLEPLIKDVECVKKWKDGNGLPGAKFQLWVLWFVFLAVLGKVWGL